MKPLLIEWIPFYGMIKYFKRYFEAEKRGNKEAQFAMFFEMYHMFTGLIITFMILFYFKILPIV